MFELKERSIRALEGVHPDLCQVVRRAAELCPIEFIVTEGRRTLERQKMLKAHGKSKTLKSRHLTGHAVDLVATLKRGTVSYAEKHARILAEAMKAAAKELSVPLEWGGDWKTFVDMPHFQLSWAHYP